MDAVTWLDRQQERADARPATGAGAGAALPLVLWAIVLLGTSGATALEQVPLWAYALLVASPLGLLGLVLAARGAVAALLRRRTRRHACC